MEVELFCVRACAGQLAIEFGTLSDDTRQIVRPQSVTKKFEESHGKGGRYLFVQMGFLREKPRVQMKEEIAADLKKRLVARVVLGRIGPQAA